MGRYHIAEVCPNGHVSTSSVDANPECREEYCSKCGEKTITHCPNCNETIRGYYECGVIVIGATFTPPAFCHKCGSPFPWTQRKIDSATELAEIGAKLTPEELAQFRSDLEELTKDSSRFQVASFRFKETLKKVGSSTASGIRDIIVDILSEAAKKALFEK